MARTASEITTAESLILSQLDGLADSAANEFLAKSGGVFVNKVDTSAGDMTKAVYDPATVNEQLLGLTAIQTVTNKVFNVDNNTVTNIELDNFKANVVDTDGTLAANSDLRLSTQKAIKTYVDANISGLKWKNPVTVATTGDITLSGEQTIDDVLTSANRVLVKSQTNATENGIYVSDAAGWTRATDLDAGAEFPGAACLVLSGTLNASTAWTCTNATAPSLGVDDITFTQFTGSAVYSAGTGLQLIGNQFSIDSTVATLSGSQILTNKTIDGASNTITNLLHGTQVDNPSSGVHGVTGNVVGTSDIQTLTNKVIDFDSNTVSNIELDNFKSGVVSTDTTFGTALDTELATKLAIKTFVSNVVNGFSWKTACDVTTTADIALTGEQTIDGYLTSGSRILVKNQTDQTFNGVYVTDAGPWTRATDMDADSEFPKATMVILNGTLYGSTQWTCLNDTVSLGVTDIEFQQISAGGATYTSSNGIQLVGTDFSLLWGGSITGTTGYGILSTIGASSGSGTIGYKVSCDNTQSNPVVGFDVSMGSSNTASLGIYSRNANTSTASYAGKFETMANGGALSVNATQTTSLGSSLVNISKSQSGILANSASAVLSINDSRTNTATTGTITDGNNYSCRISRARVQNGAGGTFAVTGSLLKLDNIVTQTAGTLTDATIILDILQDADSTGKSIFIDHNAPTSVALDIDAENTTANILDIQGDALTTGSIARFYCNSGSTSNRTLVSITNNGTANANVKCLSILNNAASTSSTGIEILNSSTAGLGSLMSMSNVNPSNNRILFILSSNFSSNLYANRTTQTFYCVSSRTNTKTSGTLADNFDLGYFMRTSVQTGVGGTFTSTGSIVKIENIATQTAGTLTDSVIGLSIIQDADSTGSSINIDHNSATGICLNIDAENTTANTLDIQSDVLTTGYIARFYSDSSDATARSLLGVINDNTSATGVTPLFIQQDALTSTNYQKLANLGGSIVWRSNGTDPNGALSGTAGDFLINGASNKPAYCTGTTNWTTISTPAASDTVSGIVELAIASEINTGTDATRAVTPDALAGSVLGTKTVILKPIAEGDALATGDGKMYFTVPVELNGMNLVSVGAHVYTVSSSGTPTVAIYNKTDSQDMLSTNITIDINELDSKDAATPAVINATYDDVATGDEIRIDVDTAGTGTKGLEVRLGFRLP